MKDTNAQLAEIRTKLLADKRLTPEEVKALREVVENPEVDQVTKDYIFEHLHNRAKEMAESLQEISKTFPGAAPGVCVWILGLKGPIMAVHWEKLWQGLREAAEGKRPHMFALPEEAKMVHMWTPPTPNKIAVGAMTQTGQSRLEGGIAVEDQQAWLDDPRVTVSEGTPPNMSRALAEWVSGDD